MTAMWTLTLIQTSTPMLTLTLIQTSTPMRIRI
ncbi:MAG: hypothetical protein GY854_23780 [Deltaproteobacteria bacterium]|nr:hypothetical protein [Deltaproteobacteria bacterium]